jgi:hypothetical protein
MKLNMARGVLLNVRGLYDTANHKDKWSKIRLLLQCTGADFAVLTETHLYEGNDLWGLDRAAVAFAPFRGSFKGVAVLPLSSHCKVTKICDSEGRLVKCDVEVKGAPAFRLGAVYAPSSESGRVSFFNGLGDSMDDVQVLVGDFNCTLAQEDKLGKWRPTGSSSALRDLLCRTEMEDSQPLGAGHTWFGPGRACAARLDRVYFSPSDCCAVVDQILPSLSDHKMVVFTVKELTPISARKIPIWRAKQEWFDSPSLCNEVTKTLLPFEGLGGSDLIREWDFIKSRVKRAIIGHRLEEAKEAQLWGGRGALEGELTRVSLSGVPSSPSGMDTRLGVMVNKRREMYTKAKDARKELPDRALSAMITKEVSDQTLRGLRPSPTLPLDTSLKGMVEIMHTHYSERFCKSPVDISTLSDHIKTLPQTAKEVERTFTEEDVTAFLRKTKTNSAPGLDGLPYRAYLRCTPLRRVMAVLLQAVLDTGDVPESWKEAVIRCIPKEGKDTSLPESHRPISLCCTDFKTFMGIIADRFQDAFTFRHQQTGYLRNRSPHIAALRVADHFARHPANKPVLLDYDKAYDRVSHEWILTVLTTSKFPPRLTKVIMSCLTGMTSRVLVNNVLTEKITHGCGVRQGDPFAPLLFLLCIDPLLGKLEAEKIFFHAHCDDLILGVNKNNIKKTIGILKDYDVATGAKVNFGKTSIVTTCSKLPFSHPFELKAGDRYLGLWLAPKGSLRIMPNLLEDIEAKMRGWKNMHLSWAGRETILNSYLRPQYLYQLTVIDSSLAEFEALERWFLSNAPIYNKKKRHQYPLSKEKMKSRVSRLRLRPLCDTLRDRRVSLLLRLTKSGQDYFPNSKSASALTTQTLASPLRIFKNLGNRVADSQIITEPDPKIAVKRYRRLVRTEEASPPKWSKGQEELATRYGTDWNDLFTCLRKYKVRAAVMSFAWRLANRKVHATIEERDCPFCQERLTTKHLLNGDCTALNLPKGHYDSFFTPPFPNKENNIITIWSIWKVWCHYSHAPSAEQLKPSSISKLFEGFYTVESGRLL